MGDTGVISSDNAKLAVSDTQKKGEGVFVHVATVTEGTLKVGDAVALLRNNAARSASSRPATSRRPEAVQFNGTRVPTREVMTK